MFKSLVGRTHIALSSAMMSYSPALGYVLHHPSSLVIPNSPSTALRDINRSMNMASELDVQATASPDLCILFCRKAVKSASQQDFH